METLAPVSNIQVRNAAFRHCENRPDVLEDTLRTGGLSSNKLLTPVSISLVTYTDERN